MPAENLNVRTANQAEPENQAWPVPGPDHDQKKNFNFFFKIKPKPLLVQHVKGQPDSSTYVREKGRIKSHTIHETPCIVGGESGLWR